jgi:hypothetical protein
MQVAQAAVPNRIEAFTRIVFGSADWATLHPELKTLPKPNR